VVASVRSEAELVAMAGGRLAWTSNSLSERTEQQAASLEETSSTVTQLAEALHGNSGDMRDVAGMAREVMHRAEADSRIVQSTVDAMNAMAARAGKMTEIIDAINGIAFQTNILALNAAVEAARAGDAGRGFAVVANEVRTLSARSAKSAAEISELIKGSINDALAGARQVNETQQALTQVVQRMRDLAAKVAGVASSISEQSAQTQEIAQVVRALDDITQRNAELVEVSTQSSSALHEQASNLAGSVVSMKLRQGCADEARALVEAAAQLVLTQGIEVAVPRFHDRKGGFIDRDLFIIVLDSRGYFRAFGMDPSKANRPSVAAPGVDAEALNRAVRELAARGGGWHQFRGMHPVTKLACDKMAYVLPAGDDLIVLCSINKNDGSEPVRALASTTLRLGVS
jgi:archaellum component FlaC